MERYERYMNQAYQTMMALAPFMNSERFSEGVRNIQQQDMLIREFLYERALTDVAHRDDHGQAVIDHFSNVRLEVSDAPAMAVKNVPYWLVTFGGILEHQLPSRDAEDPGFVRRKRFWRSFMQGVKERYIGQAVEKSLPLIPTCIPEYAKLVVVFRNAGKSDVRTINHFLPPLESVVNAFRHVGFLLHDGPGHLWIETRWKQEPTGAGPLVDFDLYLDSRPLS